METAEKLYLVPQHQLDKLRNTATEKESLRKTVENNLDDAIRHILLRSDLNEYEKAKLYTSTLQRFLNLVKLGDQETTELTLSLPKIQESKTEATATEAPHPQKDEIVQEVIANVSARNKRNASYIMEKILKSDNVASWNDDGEFIFKGNTIEGSHMVDLLKNLTAPYKVSEDRRPLGWKELLHTVANLNIPFSTIPNGDVRRKITDIKRSKDPYSPSLVSSTKKKGSLTPDRVFKSPELSTSVWLDF